MQFAKVQRQNGSGVVVIEGGQAFALDLARDLAVRTLADLLHTADPVATARHLRDPKAAAESLDALTFLAPVDHQEVWAAGVTYKRSKVAREEESHGAAQFY